MNQIFKSKWCVSTQTYVACSELAKRAGKTISVVVSALVLSAVGNIANAAECAADQTGKINVADGVTCELSQSKAINIANETAISIAGVANVQGQPVMNVQTQSPAHQTYELTGMFVSGANAKFEGDTFTLNLTPTESGKNIYNAAVRVLNGGTVKLKTLNLKTVDEMEVNESGSVDNATYGVQIGTSINWADGSADKTSRVIVENANIEVTNTTNSKKAGWYKSLPLFGNSKIFDIYHQLAGIRLIRTDGSTSSAPYYESTGKTVINVHDSSTAGNVANYNVGIYISGEGSKVVLQDSEIKIAGKGVIDPQSAHLGSNSSALKIGKARQGGKGAGLIESKGNMVLDTKEAPLAPAVRLLGNGSSLKADFENSSSKIESAYNAILFGVEDFRFSGGFGGVAAAENGQNQSVILKNATLSTTSETASLVKVEAKKIRETGNSYYAGFNKYNGSFNVSDAVFTLSGEKSLATAADQGWLIEVEGQKDNSSSLTANIEKKAKVIGLVHKELASSLIMNVDDATWELKKKGENISTANAINLNNGAVLDATKVSSFTKEELEAKLAPAEKALEKAQNMKKSRWNPDSEEVFNAKKQKAIDEATQHLNAVKALIAQGPLNRAEYTIRLTSDGTATDGILKNAGIITLANDKYNDLLTLEGNYAGAEGATLKVNTEWNSPGGDHGENSRSDLFNIKGAASGRTKIVSVTADGTKENVIDGNIAKVASDLNKNSAVVVRVNDLTAGNNRAFEGNAQTQGAGELQIAEREVERDGKMVREYYWTITKIDPPKPTPKDEPKKQPKDNTPIYSPTVSAYVQMPKVNLEQGFASIAKLHTRRGENQTLAWDYCGSCNQPVKAQSWVRIFGSHLESQGKVRLGFETNLFGAQVGYDFDVSRTEQKGHRLTGVYAVYTEGKSTFSDRERTVAGRVVADKFTGKGKSKAWGVGLTHTRYAANGSYLDLVGQLSFVSNSYTARNNTTAKNKGMGYILSAEVGRPYALGKHEPNQAGWLIEPQAQLVFQHLRLKGFTDGVRKVEQGNLYGLRGRAGFRLAYNKPAGVDNLRTHSVYITANVLHDFNTASAVKIGGDSVREQYAKTWWDVGVGMQYPVARQAYLYLDAHYERDFGGKAQRDGYRGTLGFKYNW